MWQPHEPRVRNSGLKKCTSKWSIFDKLNVLLESAVFVHFPLTARVRGTCESSLPLDASWRIYCAKHLWIHCCTHTAYSQKTQRCLCWLHNPGCLWYEELYENFYNHVKRPLWCCSMSQSLIALNGSNWQLTKLITRHARTCLCVCPSLLL